ncbi:MAG: D-glycero-beta-D-manno-heptose-7-phosphate kinase [Bryobacteraceae bacterium]|nr:D-glycero-beta-D-manno-heptose-7-phosphate kinase [Bryobacteraceae bacterium]
MIELAKIVSQFAGKTILVVGDVMLDEYIWGIAERISPEAPVPVVNVTKETSVPGGAGNVAANIVAMGGRAILAGIVGRDAAAARLSQALLDLGVEPRLLVDERRPTISKTRVMAHQQQIARVDREETAPPDPALEQEAIDMVRRLCARADVVIVSDYAKGFLTRTLLAGIIDAAGVRNTPVLVDPKGTDFTRYRGCQVITPNTREAVQAAAQLADVRGGLEDTGWKLVELLNGAAVLITRGEEGMALFERGREACWIPAAARQVYDVTGAGDTGIATLSLAVAAGCALENAARIANLAAGIVVGKSGTATVSIEELLAACENTERPGTASRGVLTTPPAVTEVE